jgi:hypothetical protein
MSTIWRTGQPARLTRLNVPEAKARHLFFDPEWVFNFGYPSVVEEEKRRDDETTN